MSLHVNRLGRVSYALAGGPIQLGPGEVHTWCATLDVPPETSARLYSTLTAEERSRSARFRYECDRRRFIVAHGVLRDLLGRYLRTQPGHIAYVYNAFGKPDLSPNVGDLLKFNLSHSDDLALIAIAADSDVGVDLERVQVQPEYTEIARHFFSPAELSQLNALPRDRYAEAFLGCWTKKEAYLKALGEGLAMPLNGFSVPMTTCPSRGPVHLGAASNGIVPEKRWSFYTLRPVPGYVGALAIEGTGWHLRQWEWRMHV